MIRWQSNPQTCAAYGLCGRSGTLSWRPHSRGAAFEGGRAGSLSVFEGTVVARSRRDTPAGPRVCLEGDTGLVEMQGAPPRLGARARLTLGKTPGFDFGRCAGPLPADFAAALPRSAPFSPSKIARSGGTISMLGTAPFASGPFSGSIESSLRFRVAKASFGAPAISGARLARSSAHQKTFGGLALEYAIERIGGRTSFAFRGTSDPVCEIFDACGLEGELALEGTPQTGILQVSSTRPLPPGRRETVAGALAALRAGHTRVGSFAWFGGPDDQEAGKTAAFAFTERSGECSDTGRLEVSALAVLVGRDGLTVSLPRDDALPDELRTHCPGPKAREFPARLASGVVPVSILGDQQLTVTLAPRDQLSSAVFLGAGSGGFEVGLRLIRTRATTL